MGSVRRASVVAIAVVVVAACTRSVDEVATSGTDASTIGSTTAAATTAPTTAAVPAGTADETAPVASTAPSTAAPVTSSVPVDPVASSGPTIVYAGSGDGAMIPIGWWDGAWHASGFAASDSPIPDARPDTVSVLSTLADAPLKGVPAPPSAYACVEGPEIDTIDPVVELADVPFAHEAVAVGATWDVQPRPVRSIGLDSPDYQAAGEAIVPLDSGADPGAGDVTQVLRADLDGNGIDEVLYVFERRTDDAGTGAPGDFSFVVARLPDAAGVVAEQVLFSHVTPPTMSFPTPDRGRVAAIGDLNGDGTMEVVVDTVFWEATGVEVFEYSGGAMRSVMSAGCGV